jgi:hypothetical protein
LYESSNIFADKFTTMNEEIKPKGKKLGMDVGKEKG